MNGAATAIMGLILAVAVARDQILPAAAGLVVGLGQVFLSFGVHMDQHQIAVTGALVTTILAGFLRTQVTAPVAADGSVVARTTVGSAH